MDVSLFVLGPLFYLSPFIIVIIISSFGYILGGNKAKRKLKREIKKVKVTNPYIYYRDIPNDYGIGIYALLLDYKISVRDLKAAIIDLSAKGYIKINTNKNAFEAKILDKNTDSLLNNEKFILEWISENSDKKLKTFDIHKWEKEIIKDAISLGIATYNEKVKLDSIPENRGEIRNQIVKYLSLLVFIGCYFYMFVTNTSFTGFSFEKVDSIFGTILMFIFWVAVNIPIPLIIFIMSFIIFFIIGSMITIFYYSSKDAYYFKIYNKLMYTDKTVDTLHKIYSLGAFLKDFSDFADREIDQIIIWERYFSYAYLFGLNNKLNLKYVKIYKNIYYDIKEDIDNIESISITN